MTDTQPARTPAAVQAVAPKRRRGRERVAAILQAAGALFLDKGYDAVTMTEIAARSGTAIGSLYRFFPAKEAVADALLGEYAALLGDGLAALLERAPGMPRAGLADALVDFMQSLRGRRSVALVLIDGRGLETSRHQLRDAMLAQLGQLLAAVPPGVPAERTGVMAAALLQVLKGVGQVPEGDAHEQALLDEYRRMARAWLAAA
jgi:AcrR family transcriptional regulator